MKYQDLASSIQRRGELETAEQARAAATAVLSTVAHCLPPADRERMAEQLPGILDDAVLVPGQTELRGGTELIIEVAQRLRTTPERARYLAKAVTDGLDEQDPAMVDDLRTRLGSDLLEVLGADGETPSRAESVRPEVPTELSDAEVEQELRGLTGWTGDHTGIQREVNLPADRVPPLVERVQREARRLNDHAHAEPTGDGVRFVLRTGQKGVVTRPDIDLARRIDQAVLDIGSGG
ncbi:pterin-4-alpha-carbinolamine dehydratase [Prauserella muralis]|uniref:Putative pterin-4-alpha-carbinolamine dehydratase n=1 Tax=Prauserella muralis TaxID=588067 RepID=A0A2V4AVT0_9PSEU|nr:DUF2267 domain-containing protein [Prauserella muralis]PXY19667.1 pterin-4-alpha-carbinolamine dehydratase [Prauserella muralis]